MKTVVSGQWSVVSDGPPITSGRCGYRAPQSRRRAGITLTEILISIMILGIGLVSLATLFPIGLLRLRDANRWTRSAILLQTAASDAVSRGLFNSQSFQYADLLNYQYQAQYGTLPWYASAINGSYNPLLRDTAYYGGDSYDPNNPGAFTVGGPRHPSHGPGLAFAYDPLWRYYTLNPNHTYANGIANQRGGYYLFDKGAYEARFGYGLTTIRPDPLDGGAPSAHGLQRITNFNRPFVLNGNASVPMMPSSLFVQNIFVSQEDVLWQDPKAQANTYTIDGAPGGVPVTGPSPMLPDLNTSGGTPTIDWRYSWMFTGQLTSASNASCFDGNIVIFENRPFGIQAPATAPFSPPAPFASQNYQVEGETVVEAIFGYSAHVVGTGGQSVTPGYGTGAERTVLLRWPATMADPVVRSGDWIADVTYERQFNVVLSRFLNFPQPNNQNGLGGLSNWANKLEWDNLPAQRCHWYQVQKATSPVPAVAFSGDPGPYRSMVVFVNQNLISRTVLNADGVGSPYYLNAALIAPNVVNVIPQTIFNR